MTFQGLSSASTKVIPLAKPASDHEASPTPPPRLILDPQSLVIGATDTLHVINRRGSFDLRGRNLQVLHERLSPFLQGDVGEEEIIAAVGPQQADAVRAYLGRLRDVGALASIVEPVLTEHTGAPPVGLLGHESPRGRFAVNEQIVWISLDGDANMPDAAASFHFLTPPQAGRWLLDLRLEPPRPRICVAVEEGEPSPDELERRAAVARWILQSPILEAGPQVSIFELKNDSENLVRIAQSSLEDEGVIDHEHSPGTGPAPRLGSTEIEDLPGQLDLVRSADVDQIPLVVAVAAHPFYRPRLAGFGTHYEEVRDHLLRSFLAAVVVDREASADPTKRFQGKLGELGAPLETFEPVLIARELAPSMAVAESRAELEVELLERLARRRAAMDGDSLAWHETDLLAITHDRSDLECLQRILKLRRPRLTVEQARSGDGAFLLRVGDRLHGALLWERVQAEVLLEAVWQEVYGDPREIPDFIDARLLPICRPASFATRAELRGLARRHRARLGGDVLPIVLRRVRRWQTTLWIGDFVNSEKQEHPT